jgi:rRNA maturation endonuclease Nob1
MVLWYWKIDEIVVLLRSINEHLNNSSSSEPNSIPLEEQVAEKLTCPKCKAEQENDEDANFCDECGTALNKRGV